MFVFIFIFSIYLSCRIASFPSIAMLFKIPFGIMKYPIAALRLDS